MLQKAYKYVAIFCWKQTSPRIIILKGYRKTQSWRNANIYNYKDKNGKWYPKFVKMLWRDEGFVSTKYWKIRL